MSIFADIRPYLWFNGKKMYKNNLIENRPEHGHFKLCETDVVKSTKWYPTEWVLILAPISLVLATLLLIFG